MTGLVAKRATPFNAGIINTLTHFEGSKLGKIVINEAWDKICRVTVPADRLTMTDLFLIHFCTLTNRLA